jgi:dihydroflavonol-4-reductase
MVWLGKMLHSVVFSVNSFCKYTIPQTALQFSVSGFLVYMYTVVLLYLYSIMILVTGSNGLVGSHLIHLLLAQGHTLRALYRTYHVAIEHKNLQWFKADILDVVAMAEAMQNIQQVYHCAAIVSFNPNDKQQLFKTNIEGTANVVNACINAGVKKLLFVSSVAALGRIRENQTINETMNWSKATSNSNYGESKYLAEMEVWRGIAEGLSAVIVNPVIIVGNGNWNEGSTGIFKSAYNQFPWYTNGVSGFVDVQDVVQAMVALMNSPITAQRFIISAYNLPYKQVFTTIANYFGKKPPYKLVTPFLAAIIWRIEKLKSKFTGVKPLLTKETAHTAQAIVHFDNSKLLKALPNFRYTPFEESIKRICGELKIKYNLE